ncbi:glycosyltransferase [Pseudomonas chlororaphis]|uniref:Glycosyltransferase n=1 Tax=Pseudomonas chlororaphis subsp. aurantiaca TaxID=86192 RepID=A0AAJ0ZHJ9_9PSED|nr:nucleotide disphospho-sugar-binding domain-containing protein [Pseudomonas chlororaphis]MBU4632680.1 glycosyltransferase [Pseudomonas chlororaphis subsp. aurantiaca]
MANILIAAVSTPGHVYPMLKIARHLVADGHRVSVLTGTLFRSEVESNGARLLQFDDRLDVDYRYLERHFPQRANLPPGDSQMALALREFFAAPIPLLDQQLTRIIESESIDLVMIDSCFYGALPLLQKDRRPPVVGIGVTPLALSSPDSVFYGPRIPPQLLPPGLVRGRLLDDATLGLIDEVQRTFDAKVLESGGFPLSLPFCDSLITGCDRFLQLSTPALEYVRSDLPSNVRLIGTLYGSQPAFNATETGETPARRPLIIVTQGTVANVDLQQLIVPTLQAMSDLPVKVLATTGGRSIDELKGICEDAELHEFIDFDDCLPQCSLLITNGGYGSVHHALHYGVPLIVAGIGEDKSENAARVIMAGCGINLGTSYPSVEQIRAAVTTILQDDLYRQRAHIVQQDFARYDALAAISEEVAVLTR